MLYNLQGLRALAAAMIVFVHLAPLLGPAGVRAGHMPLGSGGVDLFFVISGFVMVHATAHRPVGPATFMRHRLVRVVPLYWCLTIALFGVAAMRPQLLNSVSADPAALAAALAFVPYPNAAGELQPILFLGWTLNYEMAFYALFALSLHAKTIARTTIVASGALVLAVAIGWIVQPGDRVAMFYTAPILLEFVLGMGIGLAVVRGRLRIARPAAAVMVGVGMVTLLAATYIMPTASRLVFAGIPAAFVVAGAVALERRGTVLRSPVLLLLGAASYALYLVHPYVTQPAARGAATLDIRAPVALWGLAAVTMLLCAAIAIVVHLWIERPLGVAIGRRVAALFERDKRGTDA